MGAFVRCIYEFCQSSLNLKRRHFTFYPEVENTSVIQIISFSRDLLLACCRYILIKGSAARYQMLSKASNNIIQNLFASPFFTVEDETSLFKDDVHHSIDVVVEDVSSVSSENNKKESLQAQHTAYQEQEWTWEFFSNKVVFLEP